MSLSTDRTTFGTAGSPLMGSLGALQGAFQLADVWNLKGLAGLSASAAQIARSPMMQISRLQTPQMGEQLRAQFATVGAMARVNDSLIPSLARIARIVDSIRSPILESVAIMVRQLQLTLAPLHGLADTIHTAQWVSALGATNTAKLAHTLDELNPARISNRARLEALQDRFSGVIPDTGALPPSILSLGRLATALPESADADPAGVAADPDQLAESGRALAAVMEQVGIESGPLPGSGLYRPSPLETELLGNQKPTERIAAVTSVLALAVIWVAVAWGAPWLLNVFEGGVFVYGSWRVLHDRQVGK